MQDGAEGKDNDLARARAEALSALLQLVGYSLWQAAECEDTLAHLIVIRFRSSKGVGESAGAALVGAAQRRTFGQLLRELRDSGLLGAEQEARLLKLQDERNWLVHRSKRESRGVLNDVEAYDALVARLSELADEATELNNELAGEIEEYVLAQGVDRQIIDQEATHLARSWGY